jgi:hypothetical protein
MLTKADKDRILRAFKMVDVKKLDVDHTDPRLVKWFRFGSYNGMMIASEIVKAMPEKKTPSKKIEVT